jgi:ferredoxin-NADP reductase
MLRYIAEEQLPHRVTLAYSNRDRDSAAFLDELVELEHDNPNLELVLTMTDDPGWNGESRRIDAEFLRDHLGNDLQSLTLWGAKISVCLQIADSLGARLEF